MHLKKKFKNSSVQWINRQINDCFAKQSKQDGYRARSAYKLLEIEKKFRLLKNTKKIIDLGSSPGSWSQVAREKSRAQIFAFDLQEMQSIEDVQFIQIDCFKLSEEIMNIVGTTVDLILSDMAPNSCGDSVTDHLRIIELCRQCLQLSIIYLNKGGNMICKVSHGREEKTFLMECRQVFEKIVFFKPQASRKDSKEIYLVLLNKQ